MIESFLLLIIGALVGSGLIAVYVERRRFKRDLRDYEEHRERVRREIEAEPLEDLVRRNNQRRDRALSDQSKRRE